MSEDSPRVTPTKVCTKCGATLPPPRATGRPRRFCSVACCHAASNATYNAAHREEKRAHQAAYYATHREEARARSAAYNAAHPEKGRASCAAWRAEHPEKACAYSRNRRARQVAASGTHTAADVAAQYLRQHGRCYWCGEKVKKAYHVDHVFPVTKGGSNGPENLVIACPQCNMSKQDKLPHEVSDRLC